MLSISCFFFYYFILKILSNSDSTILLMLFSSYSLEIIFFYFFPIYYSSIFEYLIIREKIFEGQKKHLEYQCAMHCLKGVLRDNYESG